MAAGARANPLLPLGIGQIFDTLNGMKLLTLTVDPLVGATQDGSVRQLLTKMLRLGC